MKVALLSTVVGVVTLIYFLAVLAFNIGLLVIAVLLVEAFLL